jgi:large subunit ribosomal protein L29
MSKLKQLRDQSVDDLKNLCQDLSKEIFNLRNEMNVTQKVEKPHLLRMKKKERARVLTLIREKELAVNE